MCALPLPTQFPIYKDRPRALGSWYRMPYQYPVIEIVDKIAERLKKKEQGEIGKLEILRLGN